MTLTDRLTARETEILRALQTLYAEKKAFTLIGGYAVDAYSSLPRYSVDCDVVISNNDLDIFDEIFTREHFENKGAIYRNESDWLKTRKYVKRVGEDTVSVELLVDGVKCRQTEAIWRNEEILATSKSLDVIGLTGRVRSNVASRELLISMKLHSGRDTDLKDVVMVSQSVDWKMVPSLANRGDKEKVISQLNKAVSVINDDKFEEQLKSFFGSKKTEKSRIIETIKGIQELKRKLIGEKAGKT